MEELLNSSIVNGMVFAVYDNTGPHPIYMFPPPKPENNKATSVSSYDYNSPLNLTQRDYTQISIKNLSLLIGDGSILETVDPNSFKHFGIIPFPDFQTTTLTFFHFIDVKYNELPLATSFSILVHENHRSFLYNHLEILKKLIVNFFSQFDLEIVSNQKPQEEVTKIFEELLKRLIKIEEKPSTIFSAQRKMKILFSGLDDSGKTSFLLSIDQKYSKLIGLKPTYGAKVKSIEALGASIFLWDLGGQLKLRKRYLNKAHIYLYEADLLFYFIDIRNERRFEESIEFLDNIKQVLKKFNQKTPIIYIFSKLDPDIKDSSKMKENIENLRKIVGSENQAEIYLTSIFDPISILRAFSSGIAKLSPNRDLIEYNLHQFSKKTKIYLSILMTSYGLILAENFSSKASKITNIREKRELLDVFELTGPKFTILFKIFSKYRETPQNEALFKVANSIILVKKFNISNIDMFILFLLDEEKKKETINEYFSDFLKSTQDLLLRYIS